MFWTLQSPTCDDLDREDIRYEEGESSNQDTRLVSFPVWCEMRDGASAALKGKIRHQSSS